MKFYTALLVTVFFLGCSSAIISENIVVNKVYDGVIYAIPHQLIEFSIKRTKVTEKKLEDAHDKAEKNVKAIKGEIDKLNKQTIPDLKNKLDSAQSSAAKAKLSLELEIAQLDLLILKRKYKDAAEKLSTAKRNLDNFEGEHFKDVFKIRALPPVPHPSLRFAAEVNRGALSSETIEIKTTPEGLLTGGSGKSEGKADEIFVALVKAVSALQPGVIAPSLQFETLDIEVSPDIPIPPTKEIEFKHTFDLRTENFMEILNHKIRENNFFYRVEYSSNNPKIDNPPRIQRKNMGLVYPRKVNLQFDIYRTETKSELMKFPAKSLYVNVIDSRLLGVINFKKGVFADNEYEFEFKDGLLTRYKSVTPNEFIEFLAMFPRAAKAVVSIPTELIQLRINYSSSEEGYYKAKQAAFEARRSYEKALEESYDLEIDDDIE